jgi:hypothetical protein
LQALHETRSVSTDRTASTAPSPESQHELHPLMQPEQNVQRIMRTGTVWFAAALVGVALFAGQLLASGWRPDQLPPLAQGIFWLSSVGVALSLGLIGWSGCPILEVDVPTADRNKSRTMQIGTAMLIVASALSVFAIMAGPIG